MTFQKDLIFFVVAFCFFGFLSHLSIPTGPIAVNSASTAIASVPATGIPAPALKNDAPVAEAATRNKKISGEITSGDTLRNCLRRCNVPKTAEIEIVKALDKSLDLRTLRPGDRFTSTIDDKDGLIDFKYTRSPFESYTISRKDETYLSARDDVELKIETVVIKGSIKDSLCNVFLKQGESDKLLSAYADIFATKIDFNTECRKGDQVTTVFEKLYKAGNFVGYGKILFAEYQSRSGDSIDGFYYSSAATKAAYFADDGRELGSSFIKSPVPVGRLTSKFSWHRKHPILGVDRPHLGIDLAAPVGTPIMAAGDGKVVFAGSRGDFGLQVIISHANGYKTYYGHLSRFSKGLKKGSRVKQKEIIGHVGSSGLSTGPHLDYRLSHNGVYQNPLRIEFKPKSVLQGNELQAFLRQKEEFKTKINLLEPQQIVEVRQITLGPNDDITKIL